MEYTPALVLLGRIMFGCYFVGSGINHFLGLEGLTGYAHAKKIPQPKLAVILTGIFMVLGGVGVALNLWAGISAVLLLVFLVPTTFVMHAFWSVKDPTTRASERMAFSKNIALIGATLMLFA